DRVRIKAYKKTFGNKYSNNWTKEIFILKEILNANPITYKIIDLNNEEIEGSLNKIETLVKENDNINKMDNKKTYPTKTCDKCNLTIGCTNWSAHLKSVRHGKNYIDQTIVPFRFNRTFKGIPINQEKQKIYNYLKLIKNDIKKYVKKNSKNDNLYVNFCSFEYYENTETVKYILHKIPIDGNIFIIDQGNDQFGNGNPYISKLLNSPTWLELCKIANDLIITTGDYTHHYLDDIKIVEDLGNIKMCKFIKLNFNNNKMDNKKTYPNKTCDKCNLTVSYKNWSRHLKSIRHQTNDVDQTIKTKFNKTYKDRPVIGRITQELKKTNLKVNIMFLAVYKRGSEENIEYKECNFKTINEILTENSNLNDFYTNAKIKIVNEVEDFVMKNSQWRLDQILSSSYIPLPENIQNKHAIINVKNEDDKCFLWAILSALHRCEKDPQRVTKYKKWKNDFDKELKGIEFPVKTTDVPKFVKRTKDISINMEDNEDKDLWKLVGSQMTKDGHRRFLCKMCLNSFDTENKLNDHIHHCGNNKAAKIIPFVIFADFEATLQPIYTCQPNDTEAFTKCYQKHIPNNFCYYIKYSNDDYKPPVEYSGPNVAKEFFNCIQNEEIAISEIYDEIVPMKVMNKRQQYHYNNSVKCHICERFLSQLPPRGAAHSICNLTYKNPTFIPIVCHNLSGYDAYLYIKQFGNDNNDIKLIPNNEEKYISFSKIIERKKFIKGKEIKLKTELRFIDSFKFLSSSLDKLTNNLEKHQFKDLSKYFPEEHLNLVTRKLAYPYEYMDCEEKFNETCLPPRENFYSSLTGKNITIEEYENSQKIWEVFKIQNLREFTSLYNKIDVLLLTDIMENFRDISLKNYKLDPLWYYSTPGFAWDSMLRMTKVKLDLLTDIDQILMFESGIRGGLSQCSQRYSKANNKYMGDKF
ncbi:hypothetical protein AGLY_015128, partial [Aphis glycines]